MDDLDGQKVVLPQRVQPSQGTQAASLLVSMTMYMACAGLPNFTRTT